MVLQDDALARRAVLRSAGASRRALRVDHRAPRRRRRRRGGRRRRPGRAAVRQDARRAGPAAVAAPAPAPGAAPPTAGPGRRAGLHRGAAAGRGQHGDQLACRTWSGPACSSPTAAAGGRWVRRTERSSGSQGRSNSRTTNGRVARSAAGSADRAGPSCHARSRRVRSRLVGDREPARRCGCYVGRAVPRKKRTISRDASGPRRSV
jgi:hypothetical protein